MAYFTQCICSLSFVETPIKTLLNAHLTIDIIDSSIADGDIAQLVKLKISEADETEFENVYYAINDGEEDDPFRIPNLDTVLYFQYSDAMDEFCLIRLSMHVVAVRGF